MKHIRSLLFVLVTLLFSIKTSYVTAQEMQIMPPQPADTGPILGQEHAYSVLFRGNGDAVVTMRATFTNTSNTPSDELSFRIPRVEPKRIQVFQVLKESKCLGYRQPQEEQSGTLVCSEYQEPDYFQWYGAAKYQKATETISGDTLTITLPQPVHAGKSGAIIIIFSSSGYARKDTFGVWRYTFETLKTTDVAITKVTVSISVDGDLVLAGAKGSVEYRFDGSDTLAITGNGSPVGNRQLDTLSQRIGYGMITKSASHLEPLESYTVRGRYADSTVRLYTKHLTIGFTLFAATAVILFFLVKAAVRKIGKQSTKAADSMDIPLVIGGSFLSSALIAVYTASLFVLQTTVMRTVSYQTIGIVVILITIISIGIYGFLLIAPAITVGMRRGLMWGLGTFGLTVFFLIVNAIIMIIVLTLLFENGIRPVPIYYNIMKGIAPQVAQ